MNAESKKSFTCDVCKQTFRTAAAFTKHTNRTNAHDGMRRNAKNEIVFACNVCDKAYSSQKKLGSHWNYAQHALPYSTGEPAVDKIEWMEESNATENIYSSDGRIRSKV